ncbi:hypothetical protein DEH69_00685 [Streptomyces sp. PT12]|nr:hypothetical protein DEH69_00685 [Streptomyces sp. PT12]
MASRRQLRNVPSSADTATRPRSSCSSCTAPRPSAPRPSAPRPSAPPPSARASGPPATTSSPAVISPANGPANQRCCL